MIFFGLNARSVGTNEEFPVGVQDNLDFSGFIFPGETLFTGCTFEIDVSFTDAIFCGDAWFGESTFAQSASFIRAVFHEDAWFGGARFGGEEHNVYYIDFTGAKFKGAARFRSTFFNNVTWFDNVKFCDFAWFPQSNFRDYTSFARAVFKGDVVFAAMTSESACPSRTRPEARWAMLDKR